MQSKAPNTILSVELTHTDIDFILQGLVRLGKECRSQILSLSEAEVADPLNKKIADLYKERNAAIQKLFDSLYGQRSVAVASKN